MRLFSASVACVLLLASHSGCGKRDASVFVKPPHDFHVAAPTGFTSDSAMVVSAHPEATRVGLAVLKQGGNAADAAVAVHFALAVCFPYAGNIGGGGFALYRKADGVTQALDFRETAPAAAYRDMYLDDMGNVVPGKSEAGILSVGVPGSVDGMAELHKRHGSLPWKELLSHAVALADTGFAATENDALWLNKVAPDFRKHNSWGGYLVAGAEWKAGDRIVQKDMAETLRRIQNEGRAGFYEGITADLLISQMQASGGLVTQEDLKSYRSLWRKPLEMAYKGLQIHSMPPPSGGGLVLMQSIGMLDGFTFDGSGPEGAQTVHVMVEVLRRAFADRIHYVGDPAFVKIPAGLLDADYLAARAHGINHGKATPSQEITQGNPEESEETTHFSIIDTWGNAVSVTTTINGPFGSKVWVKGAGFLLNNEMDDFSSKPGAANMFGMIGNEVNAIAPGKRMASSMAPTIVTQDGHLRMVIGTPGGSTIPVSLLQCFLNVFEHGMSMQEAVAHKRFHHQGFPDEIAIEDGAFPDETWHQLRKMGHQVCLREPIGRVNAILVHPGGTLEAGADPRRDDCAAGF